MVKRCDRLAASRNKREAWDSSAVRTVNAVAGQPRGHFPKAFGMRILVSLDGSKNFTRAVQSVGQLLPTTREVSVTLFHMLEPHGSGLVFGCVRA